MPATLHYFWTKVCADCRKHWSPSEGIPGSIWLSWEPGMSTLPHAIAAREAYLHCLHYEEIVAK